MIYQDRYEIRIGSGLLKSLKKELERAREFFKRKDRAQERFAFNPTAWEKTRADLERLFDGTCAYCETRVSQATSRVEHFRPISEACDLQGTTSPDWYWWLAYEWDNLYLVCTRCSDSKRNLFPVIGKRAAIGTRGDGLAREKNLIVDPCVDDPSRYLRFQDDGTVQSSSVRGGAGAADSGPPDRGAVTISVLGLNRPDLIEARRKTAQTLLRKMRPLYAIRAGRTSRSRPLGAILNELISETDQFGEYIAVKRQVVARELVTNPDLRRHIAKLEPEKLGELEGNLIGERAAERRFLKSARSTPKSSIPTRRLTAGKSRIGAAPQIAIRYDNVFIRRVEIQNFRAITQLTLDLEAPAGEPLSAGPDPSNAVRLDEEGVGWKVLLGENGTGKSSFLKALAIALMGQDFYIKHSGKSLPPPERIFNNKSKQKKGYVKVELSKGEPIHVEFTRSSLNFLSGRDGAAGAFIRGYGAARLYSHRSTRGAEDGDRTVQRVDNLLQPEHLLEDPNEWLRGLSAPAFDSVGLVMRDLLNLPKKIKTPLTRMTVKRRREVFLDSGQGPLPIDELSDGYNSIIAFMSDIMRGLPETMHDKKLATGIVLLDEIDAHLHPRWKMQIVGSLRRCFPNLQFVVTTHEPLCLRGLREGEIVVIRKAGDETIVDDDLPSPLGMRVDQLLTSELFGLDSTVDPDAELWFQEYYQLLALPRTDPDQKRRIAELKALIAPLNKLGSNRRDRLVYEAIDEYIAEERHRPGGSRSHSEAMKKRVREIWSELEEGGRRG